MCRRISPTVANHKPMYEPIKPTRYRSKLTLDGMDGELGVQTPVSKLSQPEGPENAFDTDQGGKAPSAN
jgi:hypothetical protein